MTGHEAKVERLNTEFSLEEKATSDIMKILMQDGLTFKQSKSIFERVQVLFMESSKNFLERSNAKEVLEVPTRYDDFRDKEKNREDGEDEQGRISKETF